MLAYPRDNKEVAVVDKCADGLSRRSWRARSRCQIVNLTESAAWLSLEFVE